MMHHQFILLFNRHLADQLLEEFLGIRVVVQVVLFYGLFEVFVFNFVLKVELVLQLALLNSQLEGDVVLVVQWHGPHLLQSCFLNPL